MGGTSVQGGVKGLAALTAVPVSLPLFGGSTALLLDTYTVLLARGWVLEQIITGVSLPTLFDQQL